MNNLPRTAIGGRLLLLCLLALLNACASAPQTRHLLAGPRADLPPAAGLEGVPFFAQELYQCGPAALAMVLGASGSEVVPDELVPKVYVPQREGSFQVEILAATRQYGRLALPISPRLESLLHWIAQGEPVLVLQNRGPDWYPVWHYAVAIGYDLEAGEILLHSGVTENYRVSLATFENTWARSAYWGMVALVPGSLPYPDDAQSYFTAAAALEETNPGLALQDAWEVAIRAWPQRPEFSMGLANEFYRQGDIPRALAAYRGMVDRHPGYLPGYNNLASLQLELGNREAAIAIAERGLEVAGGSNAYLEATLAAARQQ